MSNKDRPRRLYLVDGTAQFYRAYYALGRLSNSDGLPTNAIYGFTAMLRKLIKDEAPAFLAVAFDPPGPVFRHEQYAEYKANRPPMPEDLKLQFPYARRVCEVLGVAVLELEGFEADDVIATFTERARDAGYEVVVVASDKDLLQLVGEDVTVFDPVKNVRLDPQGVLDAFGVPPEHVIDVLALMGDSVDNIPGVPGVGRKTALAVVSTYGDVEAVIARAGRFTATHDARDQLVSVLDALGKEPELTEEGLTELRGAFGEFGAALDVVTEVEQDPSWRERFGALRESLAEAGLDALSAAIGQPGRKALKPLMALKRDLKAMDRGSSRKIWYSIRDHAEEARMSRRLATLHFEVPLPFDTEQLALAETDRGAARALFAAMGFRRWTREFEDAPLVEETRPEVGGSQEDQLVCTTEGLHALADACREAGRFAVTALASDGDPLRATLVGIALAPAGDPARYVPLHHEYLGVPRLLSLDRIHQYLAPLLSDPGLTKVGHDVKRQLHLLRGFDLDAENWEQDTRLAAFLLNPGRANYELSRITGEILGQEAPDPKDLLGSGAKRRAVQEVEVGPAARFAAGRAEATLSLAVELAGRMEEAGLAELYRSIDGPLIPVLARMERWGIRIDVPLLDEMSKEMETDLERTTAEIHELAGCEFNLGSPKQMREVLFDKLGLKPGRKTAKSKAASTDAQTLEELASEHAIAGKILEHRALAKLKSTYVDSLPRLVNPATGRVHTNYDPTGAATGRISSSDPNLQNIPVRTEAGRRIRKAFVPQQGFVFLASDYSQIELRVLAHITGDSGLISAFRAGEDIHRHTASQIFGVLPDLVTDEMRRRAKAINFGLLYGMSENRLAREQGIKRAEARKFVQAYFERFGSVRAYIDGVREQAQRDAAVRTLFERVRYFPVLHERTNRGVQEQALRGAVNTTVQGTAADLMKLAMLRVEEALAGSEDDARMLLQVHDELLLEVREGSEERIREIVREAMEGVFPLDVPLIVDQKVGPNWMEVT